VCCVLAHVRAEGHDVVLQLTAGSLTDEQRVPVASTQDKRCAPQAGSERPAIPPSNLMRQP
jgi:hypothetical protein